MKLKICNSCQGLNAFEATECSACQGTNLAVYELNPVVDAPPTPKPIEGGDTKTQIAEMQEAINQLKLEKEIAEQLKLKNKLRTAATNKLVELKLPVPDDEEFKLVDALIGELTTEDEVVVAVAAYGNGLIETIRAQLAGEVTPGKPNPTVDVLDTKPELKNLRDLLRNGKQASNNPLEDMFRKIKK